MAQSIKLMLTIEGLNVSMADLGEDGIDLARVYDYELVARIRAIVRRSMGHAQSLITTGDLVVDLDARNVKERGIQIRLSRMEYEVLELLALRKGSTISKGMFLNHLYAGLREPEAKTIDVFVCKLRQKLKASGGQDYIETVWGHGYALREPTARLVAA